MTPPGRGSGRRGAPDDGRARGGAPTSASPHRLPVTGGRREPAHGAALGVATADIGPAQDEDDDEGEGEGGEVVELRPVRPAAPRPAERPDDDPLPDPPEPEPAAESTAGRASGWPPGPEPRDRPAPTPMQPAVDDLPSAADGEAVDAPVVDAELVGDGDGPPVTAAADTGDAVVDAVVIDAEDAAPSEDAGERRASSAGPTRSGPPRRRSLGELLRRLAGRGSRDR